MTQHSPASRSTLVPYDAPSIPLNFVHPGFSPTQIFLIILAHWKLSLLIMALVFSGALLALKFWPRTYTAKATLMVNYEVNDPANGKDLPVGQLGSYIATQVELMQTPEVLLTVVDRLDLTRNPRYLSGYRSDRGTPREWVASLLSKNLAIYQGQGGSQLIYVTYSANTAAESAQVTNAVVDVYKEQDQQRSTGQPSARAERYAQELRQLKIKVDQAQRDVTTFHQENNLIDEGNKTNVDMVLLATLEGRLLEAQNERRLAEARASGDQNVSDQVLASPEIQGLKTQISAQELLLAHQNELYTEKFPAVIEAQTQLETIRRSLTAALHSYSANASAELSVARRLEQDLQQAVYTQRSKVLSTGKLHDNATKFMLELESAQSVYKRALEGYDDIMFASNNRANNISMVSNAKPPVRASSPKMLSGLIMGALAAGFLGLCIPLTYELFNRRVRCRDDIERHHGIPVLIEFGKLPLRLAS